MGIWRLRRRSSGGQEPAALAGDADKSPADAAKDGGAAAGAGSGIHNCQPADGGPHAGSALHPGGAVHPGGGGGQLGGGLNRMAVPGGTDEDLTEDALRNTATH